MSEAMRACVRVCPRLLRQPFSLSLVPYSSVSPLPRSLSLPLSLSLRLLMVHCSAHCAPSVSPAVATSSSRRSSSTVTSSSAPPKCASSTCKAPRDGRSLPAPRLCIRCLMNVSDAHQSEKCVCVCVCVCILGLAMGLDAAARSCILYRVVAVVAVEHC